MKLGFRKYNNKGYIALFVHEYTLFATSEMWKSISFCTLIYNCFRYPREALKPRCTYFVHKVLRLSQ
jgi:hypothetical protein